MENEKMEENKEKPKSIVVKNTTWKRMDLKIHHNGIKSMDDLISRMLDLYENGVNNDRLEEV